MSEVHIKEITSPTNPSFRACRELLGAKGLRKHGLALFSGPKQIAEVLSRYPEVIEAWVTPIGGQEAPPGVSQWYQVAPTLFEVLDAAGTNGPLLLVRTPTMGDWSDAAPWPLGCSLFIGFQHPDNVGAVIRSAAAFGVARVVLLREAAHPFLPKSSRAAGPALFQVPMFWGPSLSDLRAANAPLIGLDANAPTLESKPWPAKFGLVPGIEGPGLPSILRKGECRSIPMQPGMESLNAATATAIALYSWRASQGKT